MILNAITPTNPNDANAIMARLEVALLANDTNGVAAARRELSRLGMIDPTARLGEGDDLLRFGNGIGLVIHG